jgi:hypothetical protein
MKPTFLSLLCTLLLCVPAFAHELKANRQVGALMHIQPDDSPQAGAATTVWFGLVRRGGTPVRLAGCNCRLSIYGGNRIAGKALLTPALREGKVEGEMGSGKRLLADVTFPNAGPYTLLLTGTPKNGGNFEPFRFRWLVRATR